MHLLTEISLILDSDTVMLLTALHRVMDKVVTPIFPRNMVSE